ALKLTQKPRERLRGWLVLRCREERVWRVLAHQVLFDQGRLSHRPASAHGDRLATAGARNLSQPTLEPSELSLTANESWQASIHARQDTKVRSRELRS